MGRAPCCEKVGLKRGAWSADEDEKLVAYIRQNGHPNWRALPKQAGLLRCGKSCRLRWINYLRPDIKRGNFTPEEEDLIIRLHLSLGNRWSAIAAQLPGRTDNEIKNIWHTHLKKKLTDRKDDRPYKSSGVTTKTIERDQSGASPGRSSSSVVCSTVTESATAVSSADYAPTTSAAATPASPEFLKEDSFSSAEFPVIDENFWSLSDVTGMMDGGDLSLRGSSRSDDMEFWLKLLQEAGDMRDLTVL